MFLYHFIYQGTQWAGAYFRLDELSQEVCWYPGPPRSNELLRHREGIVVEDTQSSCVIY